MLDFAKLTFIHDTSDLVGKTIAEFREGTIGDHDFECFVFTDDTCLLQQSTAGYEDSSIIWLYRGDDYQIDSIRRILEKQDEIQLSNNCN